MISHTDSEAFLRLVVFDESCMSHRDRLHERVYDLILMTFRYQQNPTFLLD